MEILVYKTNIHRTHDVEKVKPLFNKQSDILKWHVDIEDKDRVLRVEARADISEKIVKLVSEAGYWCGELE